MKKKSMNELAGEWYKDINIKCSLQEYLEMTDAEYQTFLVGKCLEKENEFSWEKKLY